MPATMPRTAVPAQAGEPAVTGSILIIDDDPDIQLVIQVALEDAGFDVVPALSAEQGLLAAREQAVDLALLDLRLPGLHGLEALPSLRATSPIPILVITAQAAGQDLPTALLKGADDYLTKPFSTRELVSRVRAQLAPLPWPECVQFEGLQVCPATGQVSVDGELVPLTTAELRLLAHLVGAGGRVAGPNELLRDVWGHRSAGDLRIVTSMVQRVRSKVGDVGLPQVLTFSPGLGYQVRPEALIDISAPRPRHQRRS